MNISLSPASQALLAKVDLTPAIIETRIPMPQQPEYVAALMYLTECSETGETAIQPFIRNLVEACRQLGDVGAWDAVRRVLLTPLHSTHTGHLDELFRVWRLNQEQIELYTRLLGRYDRWMEAVLLRGLGIAYYHLTDNQDALTYFEQSRALFLQEGAALEAAQILFHLGLTVLHNGGNLPKAEAYLLAARQELSTSTDYNTQMQTLSALALVALQQGDYGAARRYHTESLAIQNQYLNTNEISRAWLYLTIGRCCTQEGDLGAAAYYLRHGLRLFLGQKFFDGCAWALMEWSSLLAVQHKYQAVRAVHRYLLRHHDQSRPGPLTAWIYNLAGHIALKTGDAAYAFTLFQKKLAIQYELGHQVGIIRALSGSGCALVQLQRFAEGARLLSAVTALCQQQHLILPSFERANAEQALALLHANLAPPTFSTAWAAGQSLTLAEAIAAALGSQASVISVSVC